MTPQEYQDKTIQAMATGAPIFLTKDELRWLFSTLLAEADHFNQKRNLSQHLNPCEKQDFLFAVGIGNKCALEIGRN